MIVSSQYFTTISTKSKIKIPNNNTFGLISYIFHEKYRLKHFFPPIFVARSIDDNIIKYCTEKN